MPSEHEYILKPVKAENEWHVTELTLVGIEQKPPHCWICDIDMTYYGRHRWYDGTLRDTWSCTSCGNVKNEIVDEDPPGAGTDLTQRETA